MDSQIKHFHFIGIGGIGMSAIASLFLRQGYRVTGSDMKENRLIEELRGQGAQIFLGHHPGNIQGEPCVVYSSAIKEDNPEIKEALGRNLTVIRRAQALALLMEGKRVIAVAGSHGKTTTTSLFGHTLIQAGLSPSVVAGGVLRNMGSNACSGESSLFLAEADESDGSFLCYKPTYSVITNIDYEHMDYYRAFENQVAAFSSYIRQTDPGGALIVCADDKRLLDLSRQYSGKVISYGLGDQARIQARNIKLEGLHCAFDCFSDGERLGHIRLALGGMHNVSNSLAVIAAALELALPMDTVAGAFRSYQGAHRRLEIKWNDENFTLIDDYAHHPTEIQATLAALRQFPARRRMILFQPHRYSRTQLLLDKFAVCFSDADYLLITDIYAAGEPAVEGVTGEALWKRVREQMPDREVIYVPRARIAEHVFRHLQPGDVIVTMGAGDIVNVQDEIIKHLQTHNVQESQRPV